MGEGVFEVRSLGEEDPEVLLSYLLKEGVRIVTFSRKRYNLEQIFFQYTHGEESPSSSEELPKEAQP
jgi:hypothetical protein